MHSSNNQQLCDLIINLLSEKKAENVVSINLSANNAVAEYFVIASANSKRQLLTMADFLHQELKALGIKVTVEGTKDSDWILVDCNGIVVVHLFKPETREFYNLEKMWQPN